MNAIFNNTTGRVQSTTYIDASGTERVHYTGVGRYDSMTGQRRPTPDLTVVDYIATSDDDLEVLSLDAAALLANAAATARYCKGWHEITENDWHEALEVLPPENWRNTGGVSIFRSCEYTSGSITTHYAHYDGRYWSANLSADTDYTEIANQIHQLTGEEVAL